MNTIEAKHKLSINQGIHIKRINRWYSNPSATIKTQDALKLVEFFGLSKMDDLFEKVPTRAASKKVITHHN